jgi:multidrug efflux system membrane fusion protein
MRVLGTVKRKLDETRSGQVAAAAVVALLLATCAKPPLMDFERPPAPVTVATAVAKDVPNYLDEVGKTAAREVVSIQPQVSGRITEIHFTDGADVKTGDLLFTIDPRPYQAQLDSSVASLAQAKANLEWAKIEFGRVQSLVNTKAISKSDYDSKQNAVDVAQAQVGQGEAAVETAKLNLEYCSIRSPIDGRAGQRLVDLGNVVSPNTGSLLIIQRLDPIYADFTVTESDLSAVQSNMAHGTLRVEVRLPDDPSHPREGDLTFLDNAVREATGTVKLRATLDNHDRMFWPGRFVRVRLVLSTQQGAVLVPAVAPQISANGTFVYVAKEDSTAELRPVTLGQRQGDQVVVERGLAAGERVVVSGHLGVIPGAKMNVQGPASAANPPARQAEGNS